MKKIYLNNINQFSKISNILLQSFFLYKNKNRKPDTLILGCPTEAEFHFLTENCSSVTIFGEPNNSDFEKCSCSYITSLSELSNIDRKFDLISTLDSSTIFSNDKTSDLLEVISGLSAKNGLISFSVVSDFQEDSFQNPSDLYLFRSNELLDYFQELKVMELNNNVKSRGIFVNEIIIRNRETKSCTIKYPTRLGLLTLLGTLIMVSLCVLGYSDEAKNAMIWPGTIFQSVCSALFGGWAIAISVVGGSLSDFLMFGKLSNLWIVTADLIQSIIPVVYYRCITKKNGWNPNVLRFSRFAIYAVIIPRLIGGIFGAIGIAKLTNEDVGFLEIYSIWVLSGIPIGLVLGAGLFKIAAPRIIKQGWAVRGWL